LLLDRGAEPNDGQGLYNTHLGANDETKWLELLFAYGLTGDSPVNWHAEASNAEKSGADKVRSIADYLLAQAVDRGEAKRARFLLEHGADPNASSMYTGRSCYAMALMGDHQEILEMLRSRGAAAVELEGHDAFVAACHRNDRELVSQLAAANPEYLDSSQPLVDAARRGNLQVLSVLLEMGVDPNGVDKHGQRALHNASQSRDASLLLIEHGADTNARCYGGTPAQWAMLRDDVEMARFHAERSRNILDAVISGHVVLAHELLQEDPSRAQTRSPYGDTTLHLLPADVTQATVLAAALLDAGADRGALNDDGQTPQQRLREMGAYDAADLLDAAP
jgi:ankyrin repeat protein